MTTETAFGTTLLSIARHAIDRHFGPCPPFAVQGPDYTTPGATFVTLTLNDRLRGCIGSLEAHRPLADDVAANAVAAAFQDPRFSPLSPAEWRTTKLEVSLLEPAVAMTFEDETDAIAQLRPGQDGLILTWRSRRSTFLPQVWDTLPDPRAFMRQLKLKAGLPADFWDDTMTLARYGVKKWKEA